jgi:hypothetical protein
MRDPDSDKKNCGNKSKQDRDALNQASLRLLILTCRTLDKSSS